MSKFLFNFFLILSCFSMLILGVSSYYYLSNQSYYNWVYDINNRWYMNQSYFDTANNNMKYQGELKGIALMSICVLISSIITTWYLKYKLIYDNTYIPTKSVSNGGN